MATYDSQLRTALVNYKNPDIARRDVASVFTSFSDLRPKQGKFVFNDGTSKELLALDGTIPVTYKGQVYNIPVCAWVMDTHPVNPPLVYVKPTENMSIKVGRHLDGDGKVDLPYLREWRYPNSDLLGLLQIMTIVFGEEPPVYSKVSSTTPAQNTEQTYVKCPYPPRSEANSSFPSNGSYPYPTETTRTQYPTATTRTPYPTATTHSPYPTVTTRSPYPTATTRSPYPTATTRSPYPSTATHTPHYPTRASPTSTTDATGGAVAVTVAALKDIKYGDPELAHQEVTNVLSIFRMLKPEITTLVVPPRQLKKVVQLSGSIPVVCGGVVIAVTVSVTLMPDFPECAPMVYVTSDVTTESCSIVDDTGLVDTPYIKDWLYPRSNLVGMIHSLCIAFGEHPPVSPEVVNRITSDEAVD